MPLGDLSEVISATWVYLMARGSRRPWACVESPAERGKVPAADSTHFRPLAGGNAPIHDPASCL
jgi:hypothetical protein